MEYMSTEFRENLRDTMAHIVNSQLTEIKSYKVSMNTKLTII